jgi:regulator of sigma E protease
MIAFVGQILISIAAFLVVLTTIVTIHELGHFWVARACGVKIDRFSIGFGKAIFSRTDKHGTEWRFAWLPLGGYVKFSGDLDAASVPDAAGLDELRQRLVNEKGAGAERDYFHFKPVWQRALITAAGPAANFVLAMVLLTLLFSVIGEQIAAPRVYAVMPNSPAAAAGFQPRDLVLTMNGRAVAEEGEVEQKIMLSANDPVTFTVDRAGQVVTLVATPLRRAEDSAIAGRIRVARVGLYFSPLPQDITSRRLNPVQAAVLGAQKFGSTLNTTVTYLGRIFAGKESGDLLNGPVGIAKAAGGITQQAASVSDDLGTQVKSVVLTLIYFGAIVSIGMGFLNLMPIPVLDGGHLLFYGYEAVARRPVPARVQEVGYRVGLALLAGLMLFATWNDLQKLSLFKFLGGLA